jgi:hypothetical protein
MSITHGSNRPRTRRKATDQDGGSSSPSESASYFPVSTATGWVCDAGSMSHGLLDETCDPKDSAMLYEAAGEPKELWLVEGADHCDAYFLDREAYSDRVAAFFGEHL